jgi:hypothetical protein
MDKSLDHLKSCLAVVGFLTALLLPVPVLAAGWLIWNFRTGAIAAGMSFLFFLLIAAVLLLSQNHLSWFTVALPFAFGALYSITPDVLPGPFDDTLAMGLGALLSWWLWTRMESGLPGVVLLPLLAAAAYTLFGQFLPGPFDEILVYALAAGLAVYMAHNPAGERTPYTG